LSGAARADRGPVATSLLPDALAGHREQQARSNGLAPPAQLEEELARIWSLVLAVDDIERDADFFALGGDSLLAVQVASRVRGELGVTLRLQTLFEHPILEDLAATIAEAHRDG
jgi:acyl carrier protein